MSPDYQPPVNAPSFAIWCTPKLGQIWASGVCPGHLATKSPGRLGLVPRMLFDRVPVGFKDLQVWVWLRAPSIASTMQGISSSWNCSCMQQKCDHCMHRFRHSHLAEANVHHWRSVGIHQWHRSRWTEGKIPVFHFSGYPARDQGDSLFHSRPACISVWIWEGLRQGWAKGWCVCRFFLLQQN